MKSTKIQYIPVTVKSYDSIAQNYALKYNEDSCNQINKQIFHNLLPQQAKILDLGCGHGRDLNYFHNAGHQVTGLDLSEKLLEIAKKENPFATILKQDMKKLDLINEHYDGIWASASLIHIPKRNIHNSLEQIYNSLKKDGIIYASFQEGTKEGFRNEENIKRFFANYKQKELEELFTKKGFEIISTTRDSQNKKWISLFALKPWK